MRIIERTYIDAFTKGIGHTIPTRIEQFDFSETAGNFEYLTKSSAVYSSNIEGNTIDVNSYMNYELNKDTFKVGKEVEEIEDLIKAYTYAQQNRLDEKNLLHCHATLAKILLIPSKQGAYRIEPVGVFSKSGLVYMGVESEFVEKEMKLLLQDVATLLAAELTPIEVFYFAALLHLRFVHIHPFRDGNGRTARLLEKWFIAEKLGYNFWKIPSEEYYKNHQPDYYQAINLGVNFYELNYDRCLDFLSLLPNCLAVLDTTRHWQRCRARLRVKAGGF